MDFKLLSRISTRFALKIALLFLSVGSSFLLADAQSITVTGNVTITKPNEKKDAKPDYSNVVVWLTPAPGTASREYETRLAQARSRYRLNQQKKRFDPHVLAAPVGSVVDFPNQDPFFHNVFSLFDGKRFDLGLYEAGSTHSVTFDRPGVSFIFCNIHPEMSAVVVVVDTPYLAVSKANGEVAIPDVLPGRYQLSLWCERCTRESLAEFPKSIVISPSTSSLGTIRLSAAGNLLQPHKNKYGLDYEPPPTPGGVYGK